MFKKALKTIEPFINGMLIGFIIVSCLFGSQVAIYTILPAIICIIFAFAIACVLEIRKIKQKQKAIFMK